jgi:hypothetical protein
VDLSPYYIEVIMNNPNEHKEFQEIKALMK